MQSTTRDAQPLMFAALGLASGLLSAFIGVDRQVAWLQPIATVFGTHASLLPVGLVFAAALGLAAWHVSRSLLPVVAVVLATLYGWSGAVHVAIRLQRNAGDDGHLIAASLLAGALGAGMVCAGFAVFTPRLRRWRAFVAICVMGAAAALLYFAGERGWVDKRVLFVVWQPAVAYTLGRLLAAR